MSLKTLVNRCERALTLDVSTTIIGNTDPNVRLLLEKSNEEGKELSKRHSWQVLESEQTFTATATETQSTALPADMGNPKRFIRGSFFNRSETRPVAGPLSPQEWQAQKSLTASLLTDGFRIRGNDWLAIPTPTAGDTYVFEYISSYWVDTDADGVGETESWENDTDTALIPEDLMYLGVIWRFREARGLNYAEHFNTYEKNVIEAMMRDGSKRMINYAYDDMLYDRVPTPLVNDGNWNL
tara:strand:+ start:248 stop:967 length:720 start_codon:yes stop_codon:yes gene_type:complete